MLHCACRTYKRALKLLEKGWGPWFHEDYRLKWGGGSPDCEGVVAATPLFSVLWSAGFLMTWFIYYRLVHPMGSFW